MRFSIMPFFSILNCSSSGTAIFSCNFKIRKFAKIDRRFSQAYEVRLGINQYQIIIETLSWPAIHPLFNILISNNSKKTVISFIFINSNLFHSMHRCFNQMHLTTTNHNLILSVPNCCFFLLSCLATYFTVFTLTSS